MGLLPTTSPASLAVGVPNQILSTYPESLARENGEVNPDGTPNTPFVLRDCRGSTCAYYQYLQGTSMASPHAAGVVALILSARSGDDDDDDRVSPGAAQRILEQTATDHACPEPRLHSYADKGRNWSNFCDGTPQFNGFYGHGIVNALNAVSTRGGGGGDDDDDD